MAEIERFSGSPFDPDVAGDFLEGIEAYRDGRRDAGLDVPE